jgi:hypothetical protein
MEAVISAYLKKEEIVRHTGKVEIEEVLPCYLSLSLRGLGRLGASY